MLHKTLSAGNKGFTLVELLAVIGIIAILSTAAILVINPIELFRETRDVERLSDIKTLNEALKLAQFNNVPLGTYQKVYVSVPGDSEGECPELSPTLINGWEYECAPSDSYMSVDGDGWLPVDLTSIPGISSLLEKLPSDPVNATAQETMYYYLTNGETFALVARLESDKHQEKAIYDEGTDVFRYELGSGAEIWEEAAGTLLVQWEFNEGGGSVVADSSQHAFQGTLTNGPSWTEGILGSTGVQFTNEGYPFQYISASNVPLYSYNHFGMSAWIKPEADQQGPLAALIVGYATGHSLQFYLTVPELELAAYISGLTSGGSSDIETGIPITPGQWTHVALSYGGGNTVDIYKNGVKLSFPVTGFINPPVSTPQLWIGAWDNGDKYAFLGTIDDLRFYNRPLSNIEVEQMFQAGQ